MALIDLLIKEGWLKTPRIIDAFKEIKRVDFLPEEMKDLAELNEALPIGYGQTISQPLVVAFMIELLNPQPGDKILDIGSGSGWTTALLGEIVGEKGKIIAIEIVPELKEFGEKNIAKYNFIKKGHIQFICADGSKGYQKEAPFDKILASASAKEIPRPWKEQLKIGGRIVTPIGTSIWLFVKKSSEPSTRTEPRTRAELGSGLSRTELRSISGLGAGQFEEIEYPGFVFVPLIEK